jgi:hypothetical protein
MITFKKRLTAIIFVSLFSVAALISCGKQTGEQAGEISSDSTEHPADSTEHPSDSTEHPSDHPEHPSDSTKK